MNEPMWYIETYCNGRLVHIDRRGFSTREECEEQIQIIQQDELVSRKIMMDEYEANMKAFLADETTWDAEPLKPIFFNHSHKPQKYLYDANKGFVDIN